MSNKITISTSVHADAKKAWDYYTNPRYITQWNFADPSWHCPSASNDLRVGGKYSARMEARDGSFGFDFEAVYDEILDGKGFTYTMPDGRVVSVGFEGKGRDTDVVVSFDPENENPIELQRGGWQAILNNYKAFTEAN